MQTKTTPQDDRARVHEIAQKLDVVPEDDFCLLAGITPSTVMQWRKRGSGPSYILLGTRYYYRLTALDAFLERQTRERSTAPKGSL